MNIRGAGERRLVVLWAGLGGGVPLLAFLFFGFGGRRAAKDLTSDSFVSRVVLAGGELRIDEEVGRPMASVRAKVA